MDKWYELSMFTRIMFVIGFLVFVIGISCIFGFILAVIENKLGRHKAKKKKQASAPIDCTGINFDRCSEAEFEAKVKELKESMEGKEAG
jgi:hypothetical protein